MSRTHPWAACAAAAALSILTAAAEAEPGPTLAFGGDVLPDAVIKMRVEMRAEETSEADAWRELFSEVAPLFSSADLAIVNLEGPISTRYLDDSRPHHPVFNGPPGLLDGLVHAGIDVVTVANNHAYDQGFQGLQDTLDHARARDLTAVGAGQEGATACGPVFVRAGPERTVGICSWTQGTNRHMPLERDGGAPRVALIRHRSIRRCLYQSRLGADMTIAVFHWTTSLDWDRPGRFEREVVRRAANGGADLVVGHGPHFPGPAEQVRTHDGRVVPVLFSLGNLIGAMSEEDRELRSSRPSVRDAPVVIVRTVEDARGRLSVGSVEVAPFWISGPAPRAPWWPAGLNALVRPLSIRGELERIAQSDCGAPCTERRRRYERRAELTRLAFQLGENLPEAPPPPPVPLPATDMPEEPAASVDNEEAPAESPPPQPLPVETSIIAETVEREEEEETETNAPAPPPLPPAPAPLTELVEPEESPAAEDAPEPEPLPLSSAEGLLDRLMQGATLPIEFRLDELTVDSVDDATIARIVEILLDDHGLRVHLTGYAAPGETLISARRLGLRRARAAMWLIAGPGPSRSRFTVEAGEAGAGQRPATGHVVIRLTR